MKVVLFCGGMGTRLGGLSGGIPKPLVKIGQQPILWHLMKYYAHHGHNEFVLCLGYRADAIKDYFTKYRNSLCREHNGVEDHDLELLDTADWKIEFVETGLNSNIGQRLRAIEPYVRGDDIFLANYADGLTNMNLHSMIDSFVKSGKIASFVCVKPSQTFHVVSLDGHNLVRDIRYVRDADILINGGFFAFRKEIFTYIRDGEELVEEPFQRLIRESQLIGYPHEQFWCMDTFKEQQELTDMCNGGSAPWEVWKVCTKTTSLAGN